MEEPAAPVNPSWRKSSFSNGGAGGCVEVGAVPWRKSTYSNGGAAGCVEAGHIPSAVLVRDTQQFGAGPVLRVNRAGWTRFTSAVRTGSALR